MEEQAAEDHEAVTGVRVNHLEEFGDKEHEEPRAGLRVVTTGDQAPGPGEEAVHHHLRGISALSRRRGRVRCRSGLMVSHSCSAVSGSCWACSASTELLCWPLILEVIISWSSRPSLVNATITLLQRCLWFSFCCYLFVSEYLSSPSSCPVVSIWEADSSTCGGSVLSSKVLACLWWSCRGWLESTPWWSPPGCWSTSETASRLLVTSINGRVVMVTLSSLIVSRTVATLNTPYQNTLHQMSFREPILTCRASSLGLEDSSSK